jgi:hypothetical protein
MLTGTTLALWTLTGGKLSIAQDGSIDGNTSALTCNGDMLLTAASFTMNRAVAPNESGGTLQPTGPTPTPARVRRQSHPERWR